MKTLIFLTAGESLSETVGQLPSLAGLPGACHSGRLRAEDQPGTPYPLIFSRSAKAFGKSFYVFAEGDDDGDAESDAPVAPLPQNPDGVDCLIINLTAENADYPGIDAMLGELIRRSEGSGEKFRLLFLQTSAIPEDSDSGVVELPFLLYDSDSHGQPDGDPADLVDLETLCGLLFLEIASNDLDSIYEGNASAKPAEKKRKNSIFADVFDWIEVFCVALVGVILLMTFIVRRSPVEGSSMYPTLVGHNASAIASADPEHGVQKGYDDLLISNLLYTPERLDIVIIQVPSQPTEPIVKRIIGLGGDRIKINFETWEVFVNGELLDEPYVNKKDISLGSQLLKTDDNNCWEGRVPDGCVFVLGDNRSISKDSRTFGFIDERYIIGKVVLRIAPLDRFGKVETEES